MKTIDTAAMKAFCRYEKTFKLPGKFEGRYEMTLDDLAAALENILEKNPTLQELSSQWCDPIDIRRDSFDLYLDETESDPCSGHFLPTDEKSLLVSLWCRIWNLTCEQDLFLRAEELPQLRKYLRRIAEFREDCRKPIAQRRFSSEEKEEYIGNFREEEQQENAEEYELWLCRRFTEQLCEEGNREALELKGWSCYGGNRLYPCDWYAARDCMEALLEETGSGRYANTLGYIYYYGRCNEGEPEYEKAFDRFSIGAAEGILESRYKLGDCYANGYGCKKSPVTARLLYEKTYRDCLDTFLYRTDCTLADAALRMGRVYLEGIAGQEDPQAALSYLLQARCVQELRMARQGFYGCTTVTENIQNAIAKAKKLLPENFFQSYLTVKTDHLPGGFAAGNQYRTIQCERAADGTVCLRVTQIQKILLSEPRLDFCEYTAALNLIAPRATVSKKLQKDAIRADRICWSYQKNRLEFYFGEERTGWIACEELRFYGHPQQGEKLKFVSVTFSPYGQSYDYLCGLSELKIGDRVSVPTQTGVTTATVVRIFEASLGELELPFERYKTVFARVE